MPWDSVLACLQGKVDRYRHLVHQGVVGVDELCRLAEDLLQSEEKADA
jgi:hypothetical protein